METEIIDKTKTRPTGVVVDQGGCIGFGPIDGYYYWMQNPDGNLVKISPDPSDTLSPAVITKIVVRKV